MKSDQLSRRLGLGYAAEQALEFVNQTPSTKLAMDAYTEGVNEYINSLSYKELSVEYKLLDFEPEPWTNLKTCLLLKYMSRTLTSYSQDIEYTYAYQMLGQPILDTFFPAMTDSLDPVIPNTTPYDFTPVPIDTPEVYNPPFPDPAKLALPTGANPQHGSNLSLIHI